MTGLRAILPLLALASACRVLEPPGESRQPPDLVLRKVRIDQYRRGAPSAKAALAELRYQREAAKADVDRLELAPADGSRLSGGKAHTELKSGALALTDGVTWTGPDGATLVTTSCDVDLRDRTARGEEPVTLEDHGTKATADAFQGRYGDDPRVKLTGHVHATIAPQEAPRPPPRRKRR